MATDRIRWSVRFPEEEIVRHWNVVIEDEIPMYAPVPDGDHPPVVVRRDRQLAAFRVLTAHDYEFEFSKFSPPYLQRSPSSRLTRAGHE
jgi:hypothetical protein